MIPSRRRAEEDVIRAEEGPRRRLQLETPASEVSELREARRQRNAEDEEEEFFEDEEEVAEPTPEEQSAIREFCAVSLKNRDKILSVTERAKALKVEGNALRKRLLEWLLSEDKEIVQIPRSILKETELRNAKAGLPPLPPYIRHTKNNRDRAILPEIVGQALEEVTMESIMEQMALAEEKKKSMGFLRALEAAVLQSVRRAIRGYSDQATLTESIPRGIRPVDIDECPEEVAKWAIALHAASTSARAIDATKREVEGKKKTELEKLQPTIERYFERASFTSQKIVIQGVAWRLMKKESKVKSKVSLTSLQELIWRGFRDAWELDCRFASEGEERSKIKDIVEPSLTARDIRSLIQERKEDLEKYICEHIENLPISTNTTLKLHPMPKPREILEETA
jgi:hypothetical protein